jgi:acyl carrier protein
LNREELTAEKFVEDPFCEGQRMYRTGDVGKWLPEGELEFIGRKDGQVKLRGYRIELEEIEHVLQGHPDIRVAALATRADAAGDAELIAYLVSDRVLDISMILTFLRARLPVYMTPAAFMQIEEIPLNSSGKIDRRRLPGLGGVQLAIRKVYISPRNAVEERLVGIWEYLLHRGEISVDDNFFEIGGHSIMAMKLIARIHQEFSIRIKVGDLFNSPTVVGIARYIEREQWLDKTGEADDDGSEDTLII